MKKNMQKSLLIIALTLAMVIIFSGAASAAPANYNLTVKYYKATDIPNVAASLQYVSGTINPTPITAANSTDGVVKVINLKNSGDMSFNVAVQDVLDPTVNILPPSQWVVWTNQPTINPEWDQNTPGYTYDPATGIWSLPFVGSSFFPPAGNFRSNDYLFIWTTMKTVNADVTSTDTARIINSQDGGAVPNAAGVLTASATITDQAKTNTQLFKSFVAGTFNPTTTPAAFPTPVISSAFFQDKIWLWLVADNFGPSDATNVIVSDTLPAGLVYDTSRSIYYATRSMTNPWQTIPYVGSAATVVGGVVTWNLGTLANVAPNGQFLLVPLTVNTSNKLDTNTPPNQLINTATVTQSNRNSYAYATTNGTTWTASSINNPASAVGSPPSVTPLNVPAAADVSIAKNFTDLDGNVVNFLVQDTQYILDIIVTNAGPDAASKVIVTDDISTRFNIDYDGIVTIYNGTEFFSGEDPNVTWDDIFDLTPEDLVWHVMWPNMTTDTMAPGTYEIKIPVTPTLQGFWGPPFTPVTNHAQEQQQTFNPHTGVLFTAPNIWSVATPNVSVNIMRAADIAITKAASDTNLDVGDNVTFTIITTNNGPNRAFVKIQDILPDGLSLVSITGVDNNGVAYPKSTFFTPQGVYKEIIDLSRNNTLAMFPGQFATITMIAHVDTGAPSTIVNEATVYSSKALNPVPNKFYDVFDPDMTNNTSDVTLNVGTPPGPLTVVSTTPTQGGLYNLTSPVIITFNHTITKTGNGTVLIKNDTSNKFISTPTVTTSGSQLIINFAKSRLDDNFYTVTIPAGLVKDAYGQLNTAMTLSFKAT